MNKTMNWDLKHSCQKGQKFNFSWPTLGKNIKGFAVATENFKRIVLSKKEAQELDTTPGVHYYGSAVTHYC